MVLVEGAGKLLREGTRQLDEGEQRVTLLTAGKDGEIVEEPFAGSG